MQALNTCVTGYTLINRSSIAADAGAKAEGVLPIPAVMIGSKQSSLSSIYTDPLLVALTMMRRGRR